MTPATLIARKEAGELLFSLRGLAWLLALCAALSAFMLLLIGSTGQNLVSGAILVALLSTLVVLAFGFLGMALGR